MNEQKTERLIARARAQLTDEDRLFREITRYDRDLIVPASVKRELRTIRFLREADEVGEFGKGFVKTRSNVYDHQKFALVRRLRMLMSVGRKTHPSRLRNTTSSSDGGLE